LEMGVDRQFELQKLEIEHRFQAAKHQMDQALEKEKLDRQHQFDARKEYARQVLEIRQQFDRHLKDYWADSAPLGVLVKRRCDTRALDIHWIIDRKICRGHSHISRLIRPGVRQIQRWASTYGDRYDMRLFQLRWASCRIRGSRCACQQHDNTAANLAGKFFSEKQSTCKLEQMACHCAGLAP
jgi:hypothetical protein